MRQPAMNTYDSTPARWPRGQAEKIYKQPRWKSASMLPWFFFGCLQIMYLILCNTLPPLNIYQIGISIASDVGVACIALAESYYVVLDDAIVEFRNVVPFLSRKINYADISNIRVIPANTKVCRSMEITLRGKKWKRRLHIGHVPRTAIPDLVQSLQARSIPVQNDDPLTLQNP